MPAPTDLNSQIAFLKGWTWIPREPVIESDWGRLDLSQLSPDVGDWCNPEGESAMRPDYVGTLEGVSGMLRELNEHEKTKGGWLGNYRWSWKWVPEKSAYLCKKADGGGNWEYPLCYSPKDRPGDCVGEAYMSVVGSENASTRT